MYKILCTQGSLNSQGMFNWPLRPTPLSCSLASLCGRWLVGPSGDGEGSHHHPRLHPAPPQIVPQPPVASLCRRQPWRAYLGMMVGSPATNCPTTAAARGLPVQEVASQMIGMALAPIALRPLVTAPTPLPSPSSAHCSVNLHIMLLSYRVALLGGSFMHQNELMKEYFSRCGPTF